jgi:5-methylcytosine-specific restriction endonuclease McrA
VVGSTFLAELVTAEWTMSNDAEAGRKLRRAIEEYAVRQVGGRRLNVLEAVLECFVPDQASQDEVRSLLIDLVFRFVLAAGRMHFESEGPSTPDDRLEQFLIKHTRLTGDAQVNFRRRLKQAILTAQAESPKTERRDRVLSKQQQYYCYLCGERVTPEDEQVDHVWPQNAGGGTSGDNLRKAHAACQILKHDLAVPGDAAMGRFAYHANLPRQLNERARPHWEDTGLNANNFTILLDDVRSSALRVALILQQEGRCHFCKQEFRVSGPIRLLRLEEELPWWPPNTVLSCATCAGV